MFSRIDFHERYFMSSLKDISRIYIYIYIKLYIFIGISYSNNAFEFKDADVVICIGHSREYNFKEPEYTESFFKDYVLISKFYVLIIIYYSIISLNSIYRNFWDL